MKKVFLLIGLMVILSGCGENQEVENKVEEKVKETTKSGSEKVKIPNYKIEKEEFMKPFKASFDIRLENKITEKEIELIANKIKSENKGYDKYFILYYLPDMKMNEGAWATSHFDPKLKINILGLTLEDSSKIENSNLIPEGEIIGVWLDDSIIKRKIYIFKTEDQYNIRYLYADESFEDIILIKKDDNIYVYENDFGEYVKIENDGHLGWYSENGRAFTAIKIQ